MEDLDQYVDAYEGSFPYARDNHGVLNAYVKEMVKGCQSLAPSLDICSLGIGYETVSRGIGEQLAGRIGSYTAVEGSRLLIDRYQKNADFAYDFHLVHAYFENFETDRRFDVIEMGFVLEHVSDPALVVRRFAHLLKPGGVICAAVPNALSMHRVLGMRAGLLPDPYVLNEWDLKLGHKRYYDRKSFRALFEDLNLQVTREAGLMLKPFATSQMDALNLPDSVWDVLNHSGDLAPDYAYGTYAEVRVRPD
jgi:SAM-dependent methyltransferase